MPSRSYRVRFAKQGETDLSQSTNVDFTLSTTGGSTAGFLTSLRRWGGQEVEPTKGRAKSRGIRFNVGESSTGEEFTQHVSDSQGRAVLQRRFLDVSARPTTDTSWTSTHVQASGKLTSLAMNDRIGEWEVVAQDERLVERETEAFVAVNSSDPTSSTGRNLLHGTTTTQVWPMGLTRTWDGFREAPGDALWRVAGVSTEGDDRATVNQVGTDGVLNLQTWMPSGLRQLVKDDLRLGIDEISGATGQSGVGVGTTVGGTTAPWFDTLVLKSSGKEFPLRSGIIEDGGRVGVQEENSVSFESVVVLEGATLSEGDEFSGYLAMPNHEPTEMLPKHIGGSSGTHAVTLAKQLLQAAGVRIDSTQFSALEADRSLPNVSFRITQSERLDRWLEQNIWQPFMLVPAVNRRGELSPRRMRMPDGEILPNTSNLQTLGSSNVSEVPTWEHLPTEVVHELRYKWASVDDIIARQSEILASSGPPEEMTGDMLPVREKEIVEEHDRTPAVGKESREVALRGVHDKSKASKVAAFHSEETFLRLGDGAIRTETKGLEALESVDVGEFVTIDLDIYPNIGQQSRGGKRILQVTQREFTVKGPNVEFMDVGQDATPLTAPSLSISLSTDTARGRRHSIEVDIGSTGQSVLLQFAASTDTGSTAAPAGGSALWEDEGVFGINLDSTDPPLTFFGRPSGQRHWVRGRSVKPGRIGSTWSVSNSTVTEALAAPTNLSTSNVESCRADVSVTYAESDYPCEILLDSSVQKTLIASSSGTTITTELQALTPGSTHNLEARHADSFGGVGNSATTTLTPSTTTSQAPKPDGVWIKFGEGTT